MELKIVVVPPHPLYSFFLSTSTEDFALPNMAENWGHGNGRQSLYCGTKFCILLGWLLFKSEKWIYLPKYVVENFFI